MERREGEIDIARRRLHVEMPCLRRGFRPSAVLPDACEAGTVASTPEEVPTIACVPAGAYRRRASSRLAAATFADGKEDASPPGRLVAGLVASGAINVALLAFVLCWRGSARRSARR